MVDIELYGGKRGFLEHLRTRTFYALGAYRRARTVEWPAVNRLVFVCKGNICRSPYACERARLLGVPAVSFGLEAVAGTSADPAAVENALLRGVDLSAHRSAKMDPDTIETGDLVIAFEPWHVSEVLRRGGGRTGFVSLLGIWATPIRPHIQDPFGRSRRYFQECFNIIDANVAELIKYMRGRGMPRASVGAPSGLSALRKNPDLNNRAHL